MMSAITTTTTTSAVNSTSAVRSEDWMPSTARKIMTAAGSRPISHHGTFQPN